jgi:uncharacterized membrane protein YphA (DoxX/SURF4 family)
MKKYAAPLVRISMALVFLWFGFNQLFTPEAWAGFIPSFITDLGVDAKLMVLSNAAFEIIAGSLLLLGMGVRLMAVGLAIHLVGIAVSLGYGAIAIRDAGLALATFGVFLHGPDHLCIKKH